MADPGPPSRHGRRERILLSLFFCLHFGAIATYVAPGDPTSLDGLPEEVKEPLAAVVPPLARRAWPVARPYLNLTATRQHWYLFSPSPAQWASSLEVVAYYSVEDDFPVGDAARSRGSSLVPGSNGTLWEPDTVRISGPREAPLPHWWHQRRYRVVFNMGYEGWGDFYRPYYARATCRRLAAIRDRVPGGIELFALWERTEIPWLDESGEELHRQDLGGYTCPGAESGGPDLQDPARSIGGAPGEDGRR